MTLVRWRPARNFFNFSDEFDNIVDHFFNPKQMESRIRDGWMPSVDIEENDNAYIVTMELPGLAKNDVKISFRDEVLTISGEKKYEKKEDEKNYHRYERSFGKFERSFRVHSDILVDKIDAGFKDGVLTVNLPKAEIAKPKEIEVKVK